MNPMSPNNNHPTILEYIELRTLELQEEVDWGDEYGENWRTAQFSGKVKALIEYTAYSKASDQQMHEAMIHRLHQLRTVSAVLHKGGYVMSDKHSSMATFYCINEMLNND